jgi:Ni/Co efflux regulator RcnB
MQNHQSGILHMSLALKENYMYRGSRFLSSLFLTAALAAPMAMMAVATPQDDKNHDKQENHKRYYDKQHKDYHTWDDNEDRSYQRYQTEHHEKRAFVDLNTQQQGVYWNWRHNNPDVK